MVFGCEMALENFILFLSSMLEAFFFDVLTEIIKHKEKFNFLVNTNTAIT